VIATLQQLKPIDGEVSMLVICPTREISSQIKKEYDRFSKNLDSVNVAAFFGGVPIHKDEDAIKNRCPHIVVGTPARISALVESGALRLESVKLFILDECDTMITDNYIRKIIEQIAGVMPEKKQVLICTTSLPKQLRKFCKKLMRNEHRTIQFISS
ncbi:hypothetical protein PENTCL1PPCAC_23705, partial [Pristionchus entomophagus]